MAIPVTGALQALSNDLAEAVERAASIVVAVNGRERTPSSGIHWKQGVIVTTDHTLKQEEGVTITLTGGKTLPATVVGRDPTTDLAVLKVTELDAPGIQFADAASIKTGHLILAIGRGVTASFGVLSSVGGPWRTWRGGSVDQFLRPDVAIYTGFSGGALVDAQGHVIGVNTSALSRGGAITVPRATVERVVGELLTRGRVARGYLGIGMQPVRLPDAVAKGLGLTAQGGLIVLNVESGGPADRAGVLMGDILVGFNTDALADTDDLQAALQQETIGHKAKLKVVRGGTLVELTATVGEKP